MTTYPAEPVATEDVSLSHGIARILSLQRPNERNPLDGATVSRLRALTEEADGDPAVRVVVITGAGSAFSAGGDLRGYLDLYRDPAAFREFLEEFRALNDRVERGRFVSIAMVNGACVAGGLELALACDFVTIANEAEIGDGHVSTGQINGAGGSQRLVRALGVQRAKQLLLSGRSWTSAEAVAAGLALLRAPGNELRARTLELAEEVGAHSPLAIHNLKTQIGFSRELTFQAALDAEIELVVGYATESDDATEGLHAFLERRSPNFGGS